MSRVSVRALFTSVACALATAFVATQTAPAPQAPQTQQRPAAPGGVRQGRADDGADGTTGGAPLAQGAGETPTTVIAFPATRATFIRITQTGAAANSEFWGIQQVRVYGRADH